ncbi:MAG TPA: hypothetical protein VFL47_01615 [Flavisolibacter sp.]|nr:hypothetical protein [Flavisolibacter sp.]
MQAYKNKAPQESKFFIRTCFKNGFMVVKHVKSGLSSATSAVGDKLKDSLSLFSDLKDAGWDKVGILINDILGLAPLIEVSGFSMRDVTVDATIPPSISLQFFKEKEVDEKTIEDLLEQNKDKEMLSLIVRALQKADGLQKAMKLSHYKFSSMGIKVGLPPDISLKFTRAEKDAVSPIAEDGSNALVATAGK